MARTMIPPYKRFNLFTSVSDFRTFYEKSARAVCALLGKGKEEKNCLVQSNGWDKSAHKSLIVSRIFIRILKTLHCAKIGGLGWTGIAEAERDSETSPPIVKT